MSARPRQEFVGKYTHEEIWEFAQRLTPSPPSAPAGFSVAAAMIEQLLAEREADEGYPGIAHDFEMWAEQCKALRKALDEAEYELAQFGAFAGHIERWERDIATANAWREARTACAGKDA